MSGRLAAPREHLARIRPRPETVVVGALVLNVELLALVLYWQFSNVGLTDLWALRIWVYPWIWINVGTWAILRTNPAPASARQRRLGLAVAGGYLLVLAYAGGLLGPPDALLQTGLAVKWGSLPPGWGPLVLYNGSLFGLALFPYKLVGYVALAYLVYATVLDAAQSAVTGLLGLLSCVSCTWPVLATIATGVLGSTSAVTSAIYSQSYGLSTLVFVVTVGLLYWRPFGR